MDDQRDYEEESAVLAEYVRECKEEVEYERLENRGLIPSEHLHGYVVRDGEQFRLECIDCHDENECEDYDCLWCIPG